MSRSTALRFFAVMAIAALALAAAGCGGGQDPKLLVGPEWKVEQFRSGSESLESPIAGTVLTLTFAKGEVSGIGGVNRFSGPYEATAKGGLTFGELGATAMAGPDDVMAQEGAFFATLKTVQRYRVTEDVLELFDGADNVLVRLKPAN